MKKDMVILRIAAMLTCIAVLGCGREQTESAPVRDPGVLVMVTTPELPPYSYLDKKTGEIAGVDVDIVKAAAKKLGFRLEISATPFANMVPMVKNGEADIAAGGLTITEGRRRNVDFSDPYAIEGSAFLYRTGEAVPTMITMERMRVAVVESMTQDFYLTRHGIDPLRYYSIEDAISALRSNQVDVVVYDRPALKITADTSGGRLSVSTLETREKYGVAVNKSRKDVLSAINEVIKERKAK